LAHSRATSVVFHALSFQVVKAVSKNVFRVTVWQLR
jgi:hypothetical protein